MDGRVKVTVFTPTFNRAYIIHQLYASLLAQTDKRFEWLVVDDGSTDGTEKLIEQWQQEWPPFPIRYVKQSNAGKCMAINHALDLAEGKLFYTVDSDDYLTEDAVEKLIKWESELPHGAKYCGVAGNLGTGENITPNSYFKNDYCDGTFFDRYGAVDGERAIAVYTEVHRQYLYPSFPGEKFMTEAVAWNRMARDGYRMRWYNDIICIYEYREDGLTKAGDSIFLNNPRGYALFFREKEKFLYHSPGKDLRAIYGLTCDLSGKYSLAVVAACIQAPYPFVLLCYCIHRINKCLKQRCEVK